MPCQAALLRKLKITLPSTVRLRARSRPVFPVHALIISMLDISDDSILDASVNAVMKTD
jgi:hypothetical protein